MTSSLLWKIKQGPFYRGKKQFEPQDFEIAPFQKDPKAGRMTMMFSHLTFIIHILFGQGVQPPTRGYMVKIFFYHKHNALHLRCVHRQCAAGWSTYHWFSVYQNTLHALVWTDTLASRSERSESAPPCRV